MVSGSLLPWVLSIGGGIVGTLIAVVGKLWSERAKERGEHKTEVAQLRHELEEANALVVKLQDQAQQRSDEHQAEHRRDLRRLAGLSTSVEPPARQGFYPAVIIRPDARALPPAKKPR